MARYLLVAHQTAASPELIEQARRNIEDDPDAEFILLVPATPVTHLLTWVEGEAQAVAQMTAESAAAELRNAGINVVRTAVGDASPIAAIEDEIRTTPDYAAIVICTFPPGISRWLGLDLPRRAEKKFSLPVVHVVARREG